MRAHTWWYIARASGIVSWALAALAVIGGLQLSIRLLRRPTPAWMLDVHRFLAGLAVAFLGMHIVGLAADQFINFGPTDLLVPFASSYKPGAVAFGVVAMYLLLAVEMTSLMMRHIPRRRWHAIHLSSYVVFVTATIHGLTAGTDRHDPIFQWACLITATIVLMMTLVRVWSPRRESQRTGGSPSR